MKNCLLALFLHMPQAHNEYVMPLHRRKYSCSWAFTFLLCCALRFFFFPSTMLFAIGRFCFFCFCFAHSFSRSKVGLGQGHLPLAKQIGIIAAAANKRRGSTRKPAASRQPPTADNQQSKAKQM